MWLDILPQLGLKLSRGQGNTGSALLFLDDAALPVWQRVWKKNAVSFTI